MVPSIQVSIFPLFVCVLFIRLGIFGFFFSIINKHKNNKCSIMSQKIHHQIIRVVLIENKICCWWTPGFLFLT